MIERSVATRLSPRLAVSCRQFGHAEGTAQAIYLDDVVLEVGTLDRWQPALRGALAVNVYASVVVLTG